MAYLSFYKQALGLPGPHGYKTVALKRRRASCLSHAAEPLGLPSGIVRVSRSRSRWIESDHDPGVLFSGNLRARLSWRGS